MAQQALDGQASEQATRRGRGSTKPFPVMKFEDVLILPQTILSHGANRRLRRITLFDRLGKSPDSGPSRQLIITSGRYGLTSGGVQAEHIAITEVGIEILESDHPTNAVFSKKFECSIGKFEVFRQIYESLMSQRVPADDVLTDLFSQAGLPSSDLEAAAGVFVANLRYLGLIRLLSGAERIISIDQLLEESPTDSEDISPEYPIVEPAVETATPVTAPKEESRKVAGEAKRPALHIDIQVHIDPTSSAEQIDQIFASMAKHLYGNES